MSEEMEPGRWPKFRRTLEVLLGEGPTREYHQEAVEFSEDGVHWTQAYDMPGCLVEEREP